GLKVTDLAGRRISFARASGRYFAKYLSSMTLLIGYIMAGFTERKQALHDMIAGTLVIRTQ
ncbi:MAG: RDD family protein, partial [Acidobacteria bacterium]